ncbi:MAG: hypothetical protein U0794_21610 [Isosphaeraceae bacterium]
MSPTATPKLSVPRRPSLRLAVWTVAVTVMLGAVLPTRVVRAGDDALSEGRKLLSEGDQLADKGDTTEAVIRYKRAFEKLLPGLRKLPFKSEVKRDVTAREAMKDLLIKEIDEEMTPEEFRANELGMKALGFFPASFDLKQTMVQVYSEEIAAFYDTKTKTMHLIKEPEVKNQKAPSFLERLLGKKSGFDKDENKTVIAHELTHALADQNFDIDRLQKSIKNDDDRDLALSALIEGEATLAMLGAQMEDWDGTMVRQLPAANLERVFGFLIPLMPLAGGKSLREAPVILSESMIFPYLRGLVFCAKLTNDGGWEAIDQAYKQPPLSTEQILHPEAYRARPDAPTAVDLGQLDAGKGWKELGRNVVGEMQLGVLLRRHGGKNAAAGWDGDQYAVFEGPDKQVGLVWFTTWDTEGDAVEFQRGYSRFQTTKLGEKTPEPSEFPPSLRRTGAREANFVVERSGKDVVVVEGFPSEATQRLVGAALKALKSEKK